jgi:lysophospholipase L1-like esterase
LNRRAVLKAAAAALALSAVGGGAAYQQWRARQGRQSDRISGEWPELGQGAQWLLPDLHDATMVVPDRPHDVMEARDPARRAAVRRVRTFKVNTSARRLRGDTLGLLPAPGATRIVGIGDSVTFGWGVADTESWPAQLAAELGRRGRTVEVLNAGVPAQRLPTMVAWLEKLGPTLGIDVVLFTRRPYPEGPDPTATYADAVNRVRRALPRAQVHVLLPPVSRFDPHGCRVWRQESEQIGNRLGGVPVLDLTEAMRAAQGDRGAKLDLEGSTFHVRDSNGVELLTAPATPQGLPQVIYDLFEADPTLREALFFDDGHPDAEGFGHLVKTIADRLEGLGWVR